MQIRAVYEGIPLYIYLFDKNVEIERMVFFLNKKNTVPEIDLNSCLLRKFDCNDLRKILWGKIKSKCS